MLKLPENIWSTVLYILLDFLASSRFSFQKDKAMFMHSGFATFVM